MFLFFIGDCCQISERIKSAKYVGYRERNQTETSSC